jgi:glycosyltransferase involved in cell wall biosynthesis
VSPDITVIVPFHNAGKYIGRCIESLISQNYPRDSYEVILVDNNSSDSSPDPVTAR